MKTYKIVNGAERNTEKNHFFVSIDDGIEPVHVAAVPSDAVIRLYRRTREGGKILEASITVEDFAIEASGL